MRFLIFFVIVFSLSFGLNLKSFKYCGHIEILGFAGQGPIMMPPIMMTMRGYVSPTGIDPQPPKSCAWVFLETKKRNVYLPTIVVWSDTYSGYHADIYSDTSYIFGHRNQQPSDFEPTRIMSRNREMENYLRNAAGERVLAEVLKAIKAGKPETSFEDMIDIPIATTPGIIPRIKVRYYLYEFGVNPEVPLHIQNLINTGRNKAIPHTPSWVPISISANLVESLN